MTTNFVDRLDDALIRSGRIDAKFFFGPPTKDQVMNLYLKFFPDEKDGAKVFCEHVFESKEKKGQVLSMADLQGFLFDILMMLLPLLA